jgi:alanyl-tRNA synthetase
MMIFEENYGDVVRMLHIGSESIELCGGTHVHRTGDIGLFKLVSDEPVARGVRRVVGVTGLNALAYLRELESRVREAAAVMKVSPSELVARVKRALDEQKELSKQVRALEKKLAEGGGAASDPTSEARTVGDVKVLAYKAPVGDAATLREVAEKLRDKLGNAVVAVAGVDGAKVSLVCTVSKGVTAKYNAGKLVKELALVVGGGGGGRPDMAQAGGTDVSKVDEALAKLYELVH